ncbi:unnamed protein product [Adineta ricciae]|uniref:Glycosyltransferase 2-like domain-containing protein n=1 Tax=Adineta ricciae TaxID=249248 RepID=A0A814XKB6_ADIRI|nr:unnamed protein product [Adineta ricciae]
MSIDVSIVMPVRNAVQWLDETFQSLMQQVVENILIELSIYNDGSAASVGYAKNRAVQHSSGRLLCFQDADDLMCPNRIQEQYRIAVKQTDNAFLIGSKYERIPEGSTDRYTQWANNLTEEQLCTQIYLAHGPTLIMPTWFCARSWFDRLGGFDEIARVNYLRIKEIQTNVIDNLQRLTIWNAGKQGRKFYRSLNDDNKRKVIGFCDMDPKKITKGFYTDELSEGKHKRRIPIIHFSQATPPIIICVKLGLTNNDFEANLASLNIREGVDYWLFS